MIFDDFLMTFWWLFDGLCVPKRKKNTFTPHKATQPTYTLKGNTRMGNTIQEFEPKAISSRRVPKCQWFLIECLLPKSQNSAGSRWLRSCDFPCNKILFARWLLKQEAADSWFFSHFHFPSSTSTQASFPNDTSHDPARWHATHPHQMGMGHHYHYLQCTPCLLIEANI